MRTPSVRTRAARWLFGISPTFARPNSEKIPSFTCKPRTKNGSSTIQSGLDPFGKRVSRGCAKRVVGTRLSHHAQDAEVGANDARQQDELPPFPLLPFPYGLDEKPRNPSEIPFRAGDGRSRRRSPPCDARPSTSDARLPRRTQPPRACASARRRSRPSCI